MRYPHDMICITECSKRDSNPHSRNGQRILSPSCLPFHHSSSFLSLCGVKRRCKVSIKFPIMQYRMRVFNSLFSTGDYGVGWSGTANADMITL